MSFLEKYNKWVNHEIIDAKTKEELISIKDEKEIEDRFYKELEFGTGGLRGVIGAGSNRMNIYTVGKATQGLANYLNNTYKEASVAIAYDSRNMSKEFAERAAVVLASNNIKVYLYESLRPTPVLSYTVRHLNCKAGIVITASHNPKQYNGYKVYGEDGGQVTDNAAKTILSEIESIDDFAKVKTLSYDECLKSGNLQLIGEEVDKAYIDKVKGLTIREEMVKENAKELNVLYTPIHGSGNIPVRRVLNELGYENVTVVKEQELPDGNFPTAPYPNPESPKVFELALKMAEEVNADIIFGTDPDCDRIGVVVKDSQGEFRVLSGNVTGFLLTNYVLTSLKEQGKLKDNGVIIKTIVTTEMATAIAKEFGVKLIDVLTGFKYIGEKIKEFEETNSNTFLFGFEESYGYLSGTFVRDKDAVIAAMLICEMALYYKKRGMSLYDGVIEIYEKHGYSKEDLISIELAGKEGQEKINGALEYLRAEMPDNIDGVKIVTSLDYKNKVSKNLIEGTEEEIKLPVSNVLKFMLEDGSWFVVRPSGTEPKIKIYFSVLGDSLKDSEEKIEKFKANIMKLINTACNI